MGKTLLLEIGTEELPISIFPAILDQMQEVLAERLSKAELSYERIEPFATPRRLVVFVKGLAERQPDRIQEVIGPPYKAAFDKNNQPTKAALGFARKQGVTPQDLISIETPKGKYVAVRLHQKGRKAQEVLKDLLPDYILSLSFLKTMRWNSYQLRFARPIHWILALLDHELVPFQIEAIASNRISYGHRFVANKPLEINETKQYLSLLKKNYVIVPHQTRKEIILEHIKTLAKELQGQPLIDEDLLNWVVFLTEYPLAVEGKFDEDFLLLPEPVLITVMKHHQKFFAIRGRDGRLLPAFIAIINTPIKDKSLVRIGLERVLRARLADAKFFYEEDLKKPLSDRVETLKGIIFQANLGTMWEKTGRLKRICQELAQLINFRDIPELLRAAELCKADLTTEMVNEFPELQGIMGGIYAQRQGENKEVAEAIAEHYLPTESGGEIPQTEMGMLLSLADKIDSIVGCFGVGLVPTGTADPFALRRQAIGILRILKEGKMSLSLFDLMDAGIRGYEGRFGSEIKEKLIPFFKNRLAHLLTEENNSYAITEAVLAVFDGYVPELFAKARALTQFEAQPEFVPFVIAYKRVTRIIETAPCQLPNPELLKEKEERKLYEKVLEVKDRITPLLEKKDYTEAFKALLELKPFIDNFFDHVMVMVEDENLRQNRLALLSQIQALFLKIADLSKIPI